MWGALKRLLGIASGPDPREQARRTADAIIERAEQEAKSRILEAQEQVLKLRQDSQAEARELRVQVERQENRLAKRSETLDRKETDLDRREQRQRDRERSLQEREDELEELFEQERQRLEQLGQLSTAEARELLLDRVEEEVRDDAVRRMHQTEEKIKEEADQRVRHILAGTMQRVTSEVTTESTVSVVPIPSDEMKGRIIGREGRNIRALEAATGCDLIIDDTPDAVTLSAFDPVRREIGRIALSRLVQDGRIHPTRVEEAVEKAEREVNAVIKEAGEAASLEASCPGLPREILDIFGRLRYRTSYGQNQLRHAVETAHIAAMIAHEVGADVEVARHGALLHDLGKAVDHDVEGTHAMIGADIARRFKLPDPVAHCIEAHHEEVEPSSVEAIIVQLSDAISGGRPGARRDSFEHYVKRLEALESIASSFDGVERCFAIQAGREVRVAVKPDQVDDLEAMQLARDISKKIEESLQYPGQIRVTVLRETRASEYAR
ncbi:MAG: ribonuclease Y [Chloroflexi bacterium]|nr:ribonuclease Y [Chloroflexota bacterium]